MAARLPPTSASSGSGAIEFDYVIVGGGSAGCVLANRLSADGSAQVLLLEAGPSTEPFWVRTPAGMSRLFFDEKLNWKFFTEEERELAGRRIYWPRGKILGGTSAINGMVYTRGVASDYDEWRNAGNPGWSWKDVLPYFKRSESNTHGTEDLHGRTGPLSVSSPKTQHRVTATFVAAATAAGLSANNDIAGEGREGVGFLQHTIAEGVRASAASAYLNPIRHRANLTVMAEASVQRIEIVGGRAVSVVFQQSGEVRRAIARREIVLSAGVVGSPQILLLSGIGPGSQLLRFGIHVAANLRGVGKNLQDHLAVNVGFEVRDGMSLNRDISGWHKYVQGARYLLTRSGPLATGASHAAAFVRSSDSVSSPDIQLSFRPLSFMFDAANRLRTHDFPGVQFAGAILKPESRGAIELRSALADDAPVIRANYLSEPADQAAMVSAVNWIRRIASTPPFREEVLREAGPSSACRTDAEILELVRTQCQTMYHPVGTCKMGSDPMAVVNARLQVHGVAGLRVVDASIMPTIVGGNTNAAVVMIAEKASDMILEDAKYRSASRPLELVTQS